MTDNAKAIKRQYDSSLAKLQEVLFSQTATKEQKDAAQQSLDDLTASMLTHNLKTIEGRTALLAALIVELQEVIDGIQVDSPIGSVAGDLTGLLNQAKVIFKDEKTSLV